MAYHYYDENGRHRGEILTEEEHQKRGCLETLGVIVFFGIVIIRDYWYVFLGIAVVGLLIWLIIKSTKPHKTKAKRTNTYRNTTTSNRVIKDDKAKKNTIVEVVKIPKLPENVSSIADSFFMDNPYLKVYKIPSNISRINRCAFRRCTELKRIEIPSSVKYIGELAFAECLSLESVFINSTTPPHLDGGLERSPFACCSAQFYVPIESVEDYKSNEEWGKYSDRIVAHNS